MRRTVTRMAWFTAAVVGFTLASGVVAQEKKEKKTPSIKEIMKKGHGSKGLLEGLTNEAKGGKWDDAKNDADLLKEFGEALGKNKPKKGTDESWEKLSKKYKENTEAVAEAVGKKDAKGVAEAIGKIKGSCKECHEAHKGK